jgi:hypothetical protein
MTQTRDTPEGNDEISFTPSTQQGNVYWQLIWDGPKALTDPT